MGDHWRRDKGRTAIKGQSAGYLIGVESPSRESCHQHRRGFCCSSNDQRLMLAAEKTRYLFHCSCLSQLLLFVYIIFRSPNVVLSTIASLEPARKVELLLQELLLLRRLQHGTIADTNSLHDNISDGRRCHRRGPLGARGARGVRGPRDRPSRAAWSARGRLI